MAQTTERAVAGGSPNLEWEANAVEGLLLRPSQSSDCPADGGKRQNLTLGNPSVFLPAL